jgi:hypothetical protein
MREILVRTEAKKTPREIIKTLVRAAIPALVIIQLLAGSACDTQASKNIPTTVKPPVSGAPSSPSAAEGQNTTPQNQTEDNTVNIPPKSDQPAVSETHSIPPPPPPPPASPKQIEDNTASQKPEDENLKKIDESQNTYIVETNIGTAPASEENLPSLLSNSIEPWGGKIKVLFPVKLSPNQKITVNEEKVGVYNANTQKIEGKPLGKMFIIQESGTEIICPIEKAEIFRVNIPSEPRKESALYLQYIDPQGTIYIFTFEGTIGGGLTVPLNEISTTAPLAASWEFNPTNPELFNNKEVSAVSVSAGMPILKTTKPDTEIRIGLFVYPKDALYRVYNYFSFLRNSKNNILYLPASPGK